MKTPFGALLLLALQFNLPVASTARQQGGGDATQSESVNTPTSWDIAGKVVTLRGEPVPDAKVRMESVSPEAMQALTTDSVGYFETSFSLNVDPPAGLHLRLTVEKDGFLTAHVPLTYATPFATKTLRIPLLPAREDENSISRKDLVAQLEIRLKEFGPLDGHSAEMKEDYERAVTDLFDRHDPGRSTEPLVKMLERDSACPKCWTVLALADLMAGDLNGTVRDADTAATLAKKNPKLESPEALIILGVVASWKGDPSQAADYFAQVLAKASGDALALQEMGRAQLEIRNWESAEAYLSKAIVAGAGPEARFLRIKALLGEGEPDKAEVDLNRYMAHRTLAEMPLRVHSVWYGIQYQKNLKAIYGSTNEKAHATAYRVKDIPQLKGLQPAKSQQRLAQILQAVGKNVQEFFHDFQNTSSLEEVHEERATLGGKVLDELDQKFRYLCVMPGQTQSPRFDEYRRSSTDDLGQKYLPQQGFMLTSGFVSASLNFHPAFQADSTFRYMGRQSVDGKQTYVVAFAQQPMRTQLAGAFDYGSRSAATFSRGLAWIDSHDFQIIRLRTDLLKPLPEFELKMQTTQIEYEPVHFKASSHTFWLPRQVAVTVVWKDMQLHNEHRYSDFKLFNVTTHEKKEQLK